MTIKQILVSTIIFSATTNIAFAMDNNNYSEEAIFQANFEKLRQPIASFIMDFKTWPKEEQNKIETFRNNNGCGYLINSKPIASDKYNGNIGLYLDYRLTHQDITPFLAAIDYLKKQQ